jgi:hypothetical protein
MRTWKIITTLTLVVVAAALITTSAFAYMGGNFAATPHETGTGTTGTYRGGMMGGYGCCNTYPQTTTPTKTAPTTPYYGNGAGGCGSMQYRFGYIAPQTYSTNTQLNITTAVTLAQTYLNQLGNPNVAIAHVEEYTYNFYIQIRERDTGIGAFELIVDRYTGSIVPEMGPNMKWNTKYSAMNGMMGIYVTAPTATMPVTAEQAKTNAQQYLTSYLPGTTIGDVTAFYGYYIIEVLSGSNTYRILSVNGYTGQVWYHTWHGTFIQEIEP